MSNMLEHIRYLPRYLGYLSVIAVSPSWPIGEMGKNRGAYAIKI